MSKRLDDRCYIMARGCRGTPWRSCFRCGHTVCRDCGKVIRYFRFGRRVICDECRDDRSKPAPTAKEGE